MLWCVQEEDCGSQSLAAVEHGARVQSASHSARAQPVNMLQCVLQYVALSQCCSVLQCVAVCCSVL